ncbi:MAG: anhydro-N-acetylmuramic acid kinase [Prochloraceae cyanobacterium]|nr:anhydro-N-acetylmuramic acid kinase [Prochloraceae cyanobacterium]
MYVIGLISGTSVDGIDTALVEIEGCDLPSSGFTSNNLKVQLIAARTYPYPTSLREQILGVCEGKPLSMEQLARLDDQIAAQFALAANTIQKEARVSANLIGSHGQTVFHRSPHPPTNSSHLPLGYSLQLGRGELITYLTNIPTVSNFRAADLAAGGEGAPLVSKVDAYLLSHRDRSRCVQNLGGIGNVTYLPPSSQSDWQDRIWGWDTGPANSLLDLAVYRLSEGKLTFDRDGNWAAKGTPDRELVALWLDDEFFHQPPPKSTGRELFGKDYLEKCWQDAKEKQLNAADLLATLTEFTAASIVHSYQNFLPQMPDEVLLCGGGSRNSYLKKLLAQKLAPTSALLTTDRVGLNGDFKEAIAFAVLAHWRFNCSLTGNLVRVTGAAKPMLLGTIHLPIKF